MESVLISTTMLDWLVWCQLNHWFGPVVNDDFERAGDWYRDRVSNVHASKQPFEPDHAGHPGGHSVWFSFIPHSIKPTTITTAGSNFDTLLSVYVGDSISNLVGSLRDETKVDCEVRKSDADRPWS